MSAKLYALAVIITETIRFLVSELRAGHTGSYGLHGYEFMANGLLSSRYSGRHRDIIASFVLAAALGNRDSRVLAILFDTEAGEAAVEHFKDVRRLKQLRAWGGSVDRPDVVALADARLSKLRGRAG